MTEPLKRGRGRPPGVKNKRKGLSVATVLQICDDSKFCPVQKLINIAQDNDFDEAGRQINWPLLAQMKATEKLLDAIHNDKKLPGPIVSDQHQQLSIGFIESPDDFTLSGEGSTKSIEALLQSKQV